MKNNKIGFSEEYIEQRFAKKLEENSNAVYRQVRLSRKRIDIVSFDNSNKVIGIEIKIRDWRAGLRQAMVNTIACHESYVAIWHEYAGPAERNKFEFEKHGVGLMIIQENFNTRITCLPDSKDKQTFNKYAYEELLASLKI